MSNPPLNYVECDVPEGMTLDAWRHAHAPRHHFPRARHAMHHPLHVRMSARGGTRRRAATPAG